MKLLLVTSAGNLIVGRYAQACLCATTARCSGCAWRWDQNLLAGTHGSQPWPRRNLCTSKTTLAQADLKVEVKDCYEMLGVTHESKDTEVRQAYISKAKTFHPDSGASTADPQKFSQVKEAYKTVLEHRKGRKLREEEEKEAEVVFDIKHTVPQHRQYLEFEGVGFRQGVGFGTPSQRQRQYQQYKVTRATENIHQHRVQKLAAETEDSLVLKDKQQAKKNIISNALHRLVEDLIQESMKRGDFDNLPGQGKPLDYSAHNPLVDSATYNINKILVNNGYAPEWIMLSSEIRKEIKQARERLAAARKRVAGDSASAGEVRFWQQTVDKFRTDIKEINAKIDKYNLIVPFLEKQQMPYDMEREMRRVLENLEQHLPSEDSHSCGASFVVETHQSLTRDSINWKQMWQDIKLVFKTGSCCQGPKKAKDNSGGTRPHLVYETKIWKKNFLKRLESKIWKYSRSALGGS